MRAAAPEADLAPLHRASQRALGRVVGGFHSVLFKEREEPFEMPAKRTSKITHVAVRAVEMGEGKSEELLLQWNRLQNQLFPCDRSIANARTGAKTMPETEQARVQGENIAAESFRLGRFGQVQHTQNVALEMCPAELPSPG